MTLLLLLLLKSVEFDDDVALQSSLYSQEDRHACKQWTGYPSCSGDLQQSEQEWQRRLHTEVHRSCHLRSWFQLLIIIIIIIIIHEYYYGGAVALLLQDHLTMSVTEQ